MATTVKILKVNLPVFREKIEKLNRRMEDAGLMPVEYHVGKPYKDTYTTPLGATKVYYVDVELSHDESMKVGDWTIVAKREIEPEGSYFFAFDDNVPEEFRDAHDHCDHCKTERRRKHLYVLRNNENPTEFIQVGKQCVRDFTGVDSPATLAANLRFMREVRDMAEPSEAGAPLMVLRDVLALAMAAIRRDGFVPSQHDGEKQPTVVTVRVEYGSKKPHIKMEDRDFEVAEQVVEWARGLKATNDYLSNVKLALSKDFIEYRRCGLVVSAVWAFLKDTKRVDEAREDIPAAKSGRYVGEIGERLRGVKVSLVYTNVYDNAWGRRYFYVCRDEDGNTIKFYHSREVIDFEDSAAIIDGTVKEHLTDHKGNKTTVLTRVAYKGNPDDE